MSGGLIGGLFDSAMLTMGAIQALPGPPIVQYYLLENPWPAVAALGGAAVLVVAVGRSRLAPKVFLGVVAALVVLAAGVWTASTLVQTPRERVIERARDLVDAVAKGDMAGAARVLHPDAVLRAFFTSRDGIELNDILRRVSEMKDGVYRLHSHRVKQVQTEFLGPRVARTQILVEVDPEATRFPTLSWWRVDWRNDGPEGGPVAGSGEWTAYEIEPLALPGVDQPGPR
jgi:hypothetical protein